MTASATRRTLSTRSASTFATTTAHPPAPPRVVDAHADQSFRYQATRLGLSPDNRWIGRYVDYEWTRSRHVFESPELPCLAARGKRVLELGCNMGATAVILATLGAQVAAVDVNDTYVALAEANAHRYGVHDAISFHHVPDTTRLPFDDASFDIVSCNSVLEYVPHAILAAVEKELDRVLRPGGVLVVLGTSNALWPRELHSGRVGVNYLPRAFDDLFGIRARGVSPLALRRAFARYDDLILKDRARSFVAMKERMGFSRHKLAAVRVAARALAPVGISVGMLLPSVSMFLRKRVAVA